MSPNLSRNALYLLKSVNSAHVVMQQTQQIYHFAFSFSVLTNLFHPWHSNIFGDKRLWSLVIGNHIYWANFMFESNGCNLSSLSVICIKYLLASGHTRSNLQMLTQLKLSLFLNITPGNEKLTCITPRSDVQLKCYEILSQMTIYYLTYPTKLRLQVCGS